MTDALDIRSGGAVAVDTDSLRHAAAGFDLAGDDLDDLARRTRAAVDPLAGDPVARDAVHAGLALGARLDAAAAHARDSAAGLRAAAAVYEHAELTAARAAASAAGDTAAAAALDARIDALSAAFPAAASGASLAAGDHDLRWRAALVADALGADGPAGAVGMLWGAGLGAIGLAGLLAALSAWGAGTVTAGSRLAGPAPAVAVSATRAAAPVAPPGALADAVARVPVGGAAQVRVERYTMRDGSRQFAVYIAGTRGSRDAREPWDNTSNVQLYTGQTSASYAATVQALEASGARPGDIVHAVGHSQGAMVAERLAMEGTFDTRTVVSIGSPVAADLPAGTLGVSLRHTDDPVPGLAVGGQAMPVGAPGSLVVERPAGEGPGLSLDAHALPRYAETARLLADSGDPRAASVQGVFDSLGRAASVTTVDYAAARVSPGERVSPSSDAG